MQLFTNNADSALDGAIDTAALSITVTSGHGTKFPSPTGGDFFLVTLFQKVGATETNHEIVKCTARTGDVLTVVRAQEGTTARAWPNDTPVELRLTAGGMVGKQDTLTVSSGLLLSTATLSLDTATATNLRALTTGKPVTGEGISAASALVTLTDATTIAVDWAALVTAEVALTANRALGNPSNVVPGTTRYVFVKGSNATARTLTFGSNYKGALPTLADITSTKWYLLALIAYSSTHIVVSSVRAL